jgi:hypothetical protein
MLSGRCDVPSVLVRDVTVDDKDFLESYAKRHGVSQAEAMRAVIRAGIDQLRARETVDEGEWAQLADSLAALADEDFESRAWG